MSMRRRGRSRGLPFQSRRRGNRRVRQERDSAVTGHGAEAVRDAIAAAINAPAARLRRSPTWDRRAEMSRPAGPRIDHDQPVHFRDPRSPWPRRTNEDTDGLLRQRFANGTDFAAHGPDGLDAVAKRSVGT